MTESTHSPWQNALSTLSNSSVPAVLPLSCLALPGTIRLCKRFGMVHFVVYLLLGHPLPILGVNEAKVPLSLGIPLRIQAFPLRTGHC